MHNHHIEAFEVTPNNVADCEVAPRLLKSIKAPIDACSGDGAYDVESVYQALEDIGARPIIPPRRHAILQNPAHASSAKAPRDAAINYINQHGGGDNARAAWKKDSNLKPISDPLFVHVFLIINALKLPLKSKLLTKLLLSEPSHSIDQKRLCL